MVLSFVQNNFLADTTNFSSGNSLTRCSGITPLGMDRVLFLVSCVSASVAAWYDHSVLPSFFDLQQQLVPALALRATNVHV